jgi:xanthine dehydrogenase accessory factor
MTFYRRCAELEESGESFVVVTVIDAAEGSPAKTGFKMLVSDGGECLGTVGGGKLEHHATAVAREVASTGGIRTVRLELSSLGMVCGGEVTLLFERIEGGRPFLLFGGGHVGRALAPLLVSLGYRVTVYDPRPEARGWLAGVPEASVVEGPYTDLSGMAGAVRRCRHCFIATHGHEHDWEVLRQLLSISPEWEYLGLIGSRRKARETHEKLRAAGRGVPEYLHTPAGLPLGGSTAAEIALSVAAEVVAVRNRAAVEHMRLAEA